MSHSWSWRIVTKKVSWSLYAGTSTDRNILLDITRLGCSPKFAEGTAERCGEARGATGSHPAAAANRRDSASKGEIIGALHDPNSAMKLATGLDEMPGRRGIPEVNWADGVLSGSLLVREKKRGDKKERREGREGKERWDGGTDLDSHPSWNRRDGEVSLNTTKTIFYQRKNQINHTHTFNQTN